jgi:DNA polymerase I-like protein with 3'-5' exonuclease and polymerase domains
MLLSLVQLVEKLPQDRARIVGTVHDSILFELRDDFRDEGAAIIHATMTDMSVVKKKFGTDITVPMDVELKIGSHWGGGTVHVV